MATEKEAILNEIAVDLIGLHRYASRMIERLRRVEVRTLEEDNVLSNLISLKNAADMTVRNITSIVQLDEDAI